jgi:hypothetical protein
VGACADLVPGAAGVLGAQGEDAGGAGLGPAHAAEFEALADDGFAAGFDDAGADEHAEVAVVAVAHPDGVGAEVGQGLVPVGGLDPDQGVFGGGGGGDDRFDVAVVEFFEAFGEPGRGVGDDEREGGGEVVQVFAGVVEVHDLGGGG